MRHCKCYFKINCCHLLNGRHMCVKMKLFITNKKLDKTEKDHIGIGIRKKKRFVLVSEIGKKSVQSDTKYHLKACSDNTLCWMKLFVFHMLPVDSRSIESNYNC